MSKPRRATAETVSPDRNWPQVKAEYLTEYANSGKVDMKALAERYRIPYGTLRNRASKYKWHMDAKDMEAEVTARVREQVLPKLVDARAKVLESQLQYVDYLKKRALSEITKAQSMPVSTATRTLFEALKVEMHLTDAKAAGESAQRTGSGREDLMSLFKGFASKNADMLVRPEA